MLGRANIDSGVDRCSPPDRSNPLGRGKGVNKAICAPWYGISQPVVMVTAPSVPCRTKLPVAARLNLSVAVASVARMHRHFIRHLAGKGQLSPLV